MKAEVKTNVYRISGLLLFSLGIIVFFAYFVSAEANLVGQPSVSTSDSDGDGYKDTAKILQTVSDDDLLFCNDVTVYADLLNPQGGYSSQSDYIIVNLGKLGCVDGESTTITLYVSTDIYSEIGEYTIEVNMYSTGSTGTDKKQTTINLWPIGNYEPYLSWEDYFTYSFEPGSIAQSNFSIKNNGNNPDTFSLSTESQEGWSVNLPKNSVTLEPGTSEIIGVSVTIPKIVNPETKDTVTITAESEKDYTKTHSIDDDVTTANQRFDINLELEVYSFDIELGKSTDVDVTVTNLGNYDDTVSFSASNVDYGWSIDFDTTSIVVSPTASETITMTIKAPSTMQEITYDDWVEIKVTSKNPDYYEYDYINVSTKAPDLTINQDNITLSSDPVILGDELTITVIVENIGSLDANQVEVLFKTDSATVDTKRVDVPAKKTGTVSIKYTPSDTLLELMYIEIDPQNKIIELYEEDNIYSFPFDVIAPDLEVNEPGDITIAPSTPKVGKKVSISVTVTNVGEADAGKFTVALIIDGATVATEDVQKLEKGKVTTVDFTWKASKGTHTIEVKVDSKNVIAEEYEENNISYEETIKPKEEKDTPGFEIIATIIIVISVGYYHRSRRRW